MKDEIFLILPHPEVARYERRRAEDREQWLQGMRRARAVAVEHHTLPDHRRPPLALALRELAAGQHGVVGADPGAGGRLQHQQGQGGERSGKWLEVHRQVMSVCGRAAVQPPRARPVSYEPLEKMRWMRTGSSVTNISMRSIFILICSVGELGRTPRCQKQRRQKQNCIG